MGGGGEGRGGEGRGEGGKRKEVVLASFSLPRSGYCSSLSVCLTIVTITRWTSLTYPW